MIYLLIFLMFVIAGSLIWLDSMSSEASRNYHSPDFSLPILPSYHTPKESESVKKLNEYELQQNKLKNYLDSFDENCDPDSLETNVYDTKFQHDYFIKFYTYVENNPEEFTEGRWSQEKCAQYFQKLTLESYDAVGERLQEIEYLRAAYLKNYHNGPSFGLTIGRTNDRYDYFMRLKVGPTYQPKKISKEQLIGILQNNKYGYSKDLII